MKDSSSQSQPCGEQPEPAVSATAALANKILGEFCACYAEAWPAKTCDAEAAQLAEKLRGEYQAQIRAINRMRDDGSIPPLGATASTTSETGAEKVAAEVHQPIRDEPIPFSLTDEMVEAGARAMMPAAFVGTEEGSWAQLTRARLRTDARACLEAAMAVRGETK